MVLRNSFLSKHTALQSLLWVCLVGCGLFTDDRPPEDEGPLIEGLLIKDEFDPEKFYQFFERPISKEIDYIENKFYDYAKYVKREESNTISKSDLKFFVNKFFQDQAEALNKGIDALFAVNSIFLGTGQEALSISNIEKLFNIMRHGNLHLSAIKQSSQSYKAGQISLEEYRETFRRNLEALSQNITDNLPKIHPDGQAPIGPLVESLINLRKTDGRQSALNDIFLEMGLLKTLVVGGKQETISLAQIHLFMEKIVDLAPPLFDVYYYEELNRRDSLDSLHFIGDKIRDIFNILGDTPRSLPKKNLQNALDKFSANFSKTFFNTGNLFLDVGLLFSGRKDGILSLQDLEKTFHIFYEGLVFYYETVKKADLAHFDEIKLQQFRSWFASKAEHLTRVILNNISTNGNTSLALEMPLINHFAQIYDNVPLEKIQKRVHLLKQLLAGGERAIITTKEVQKLAQKLPHLSGIVFDFLYFKKYTLEKDFEYPRFVIERIRTFLGNIEEQTGTLLYPDELIDILPRNLGRWKSSEIIHIVKSYKTLLLQEEDYNFTYRNTQQAKNMLMIYLTTLTLYEHTYKTMELILNTKTATLSDIENLKETALVWEKKIKNSLNFSLYPERFMMAEFIRETWTELKFTEIGTQKFLRILSSKKMLESTPKDIVYKNELLSVIEKVPVVLSSTIEIIFNLAQENDPNKSFLGILKALREMKKTFRQGNDLEVFFAMNDLDAFRPFFLKFDDRLIDLVKTLLPIIKRKVLLKFNYLPSSGYTEFTFSDFNKLFNILDDILVHVSLVGPTFDLYQDKLDKKTPIKNINGFLNKDPWCPSCRPPRPHRSRKEFSFFTEKEIDTFLEEFLSITLDYKYFRNPKGIHIYDRFYHRQKKGFMEIMFLKKICHILMQGYRRNGQPQDSITESQLNTFLWDFKPLFDYFHAWSENPETFARNVILLADLFQHSSNGNNRMDINETVEFVGLTVSAMNIRKQAVEKLLSVCENLGTATNILIDPSCYKEHFFSIFFEELPFLQYHVPKLYSYISNASREEQYYFLESIEGFSRGPRTDPMTISHFNNLVGAMFNIESTFIRYDINDDNILDEDELEASFPTYKNAIRLISCIPASLEQMAKSAFLYIIKYTQLPQQGWRGKANFFSFHFDGRPRKDEGLLGKVFSFAKIDRKAVVAERINIGYILYYIAISSVDLNNTDSTCNN